MTESMMDSQIIDQLNSGVLLVDLNYKLVHWNRFLAVHVNKSFNDVVGQSIFDVFPELPRRWLERKLNSVIQLGTPSFCGWEQRHHLFELPHTRPISTDSEFMAQNCTFLPYLEQQQLAGVYILIEDVTDVCHYQSMLKATMQELELATRIDGLTKVYNRKFWEESLTHEFLRAKRYACDMSLLMFDLDHFKSINDNYGHQCGDLVLVEAAQRVNSLLRDADILGRYGGEEFAVILTETAQFGAVEVAERIKKSLTATPVVFNGKEIYFSASIGIASFNSEQTSHETLIAEADAALYRAKSSGRNKICLSPTLYKCS
ncbi:sensor domain-containing diguanylate cyclase [Thalassotalea euphylliae]|uniref:diguanylate cyclase n=1 Tax=Thalassotalea euphylliae TaxID=1655234 RepID=A0A3E0U3C1_9GAMM|nr:diguanylate cyclase [Thalassotalea euphylliae]REL30502.1 diguanylate cyclase [Thalassotalea euphylliae]